MRFCFSTIAGGDWDFSVVGPIAREVGFEGVEMRVDCAGDAFGASHPLMTEARRLYGLLESAGLEVASLSTQLALGLNSRVDAQSAHTLRGLIDVAESLECRCVRMLDVRLPARQSLVSAMLRLRDWLLPLGDYAAERSVTIAVENGPTFRSAAQIWKVLDGVGHPAVGCAWSTLNSSLIGESPTTSVPVLNHLIRYVLINDAQIEGEGVAGLGLGEGDVRIEQSLHALAGVGYRGWACVQLPAQTSTSAAKAELEQSIETLRRWTQPAAPVTVTPRRTAPARRPGMPNQSVT